MQRKTVSSRFARSLKKIAAWCRRFRHEKIRYQQTVLRQKLQGHYNYYGITGNSAALARFVDCVRRVWKKWLSRRNRERRWTWDHFHRMLERYPLPPPRAVHSVLRCVANP